MGKGKGGGGSTSTPHIGIPPAIGSSGTSSLSSQVFQPLGTYGAEQMMGLGGLSNWAANLATGGNVQTAGTLPANGLLPGGATPTFAPFTASGAPGSAGAGGGFLSGLNAQELGPFLANAVQNLINAQGETAALQRPAKTLLNQGTGELATGNQLLNTGQSILGQGQSVFGQGENLFNRLTTGTGLFPSQQAMIDQAVQTEQTKLGQQLAAEGLGNSTLLQSLRGQAALSGAAAGGQLVQGNLQLAQGQEQAGLGLAQLGISEQGVGTTEQQLGAAATGAAAQIESAMFSQFSSIASQSAALQQSAWNQAVQGYGMMGNFLNGVLASFGYSLKTQEDVLQANEAAAGIQIQQQQLEAQAQAAQAQGFSQMLGGLGQLLGTGSGTGAGGAGGGGLFGGGGGLLGLGTLGATSPITGTVGGLEVAGGATAGTGLLGSIGGAIGPTVSAIGSALGALFCEVARTVYGVDSPDWLLFRDWILFKAPKSIRTLYVIHAFRVSRWIKGRPRVCRLIRWAMNAVLYVDKITSKRA